MHHFSVRWGLVVLRLYDGLLDSGRVSCGTSLLECLMASINGSIHGLARPRLERLLLG